jgi:hypothetical protein
LLFMTGWLLPTGLAMVTAEVEVGTPADQLPEVPQSVDPGLVFQLSAAACAWTGASAKTAVARPGQRAPCSTSEPIGYVSFRCGRANGFD